MIEVGTKEIIPYPGVTSGLRFKILGTTWPLRERRGSSFSSAKKVLLVKFVDSNPAFVVATMKPYGSKHQGFVRQNTSGMPCSRQSARDPRMSVIDGIHPPRIHQQHTLKEGAERRALSGVQVDPANTSWRIDDPGLALRKKKILTPAKNVLANTVYTFLLLFAYKYVLPYSL